MASRTSLLSDFAYQDIKNKIIEMTYPPGFVLSEVSLAEKLNISRMPVRTALQKLAEEGWLDTSSPRKIKVKDITVNDVNEVYDLREMIECSALNRIFEEEKTWEYSFELEGIVLKMRAWPNDPLKNEILDAAYHAKIVDVLNNSRISKIFQNAREEIIWMGMLKNKTAESNEENVNDLNTIAHAMREQDYDKTKRLHLGHLRKGKEETIMALTNQNKQP